MSKTTRIFIYLAIFGAIIYYGLDYVTSYTESQVFRESKEMIAKEYKYEITFKNKGRYGEYMLHMKAKQKGTKEFDYYCGYTEANLFCSDSVQGLNEMVAESHGELRKIRRD